MERLDLFYAKRIIDLLLLDENGLMQSKTYNNFPEINIHIQLYHKKKHLINIRHSTNKLIESKLLM